VDFCADLSRLCLINGAHTGQVWLEFRRSRWKRIALWRIYPRVRMARLMDHHCVVYLNPEP